jgi:hypothetical protein
MTDQNTDYDGCNRRCRLAGAHTLAWGECEHAPQPEPTVSLSCVYTDTDGHPSIGFDTYTVPELARLIEPVLGDPLKAAAAARRIVHRHDGLPAAVPVPPPADQTALRPAVAEAIHRDLLAHRARRDQGLLGIVPRLATAVLAVLPEQTDRAAVLREAANTLAALGPEDSRVSGPKAWSEAVEVLRRVAAEEQPAKPDRCPHGCDTSICPCLACEADEEQPAETQAQEPPTEADIVRAHVLAVHQIGEQLAGIESWMWEHLANVRDAAPARPAVGEQRTETQEALPPLVDELRGALAKADGFNPEGLEPHDYQTHATAVRRVVARYIRADVELDVDGRDDDCCRNYGRALARWLEADALHPEPQP